MRVGLWNLEPQIVNSAMMRVSTHHKNRGDEVEMYERWKGYQHYDKIYVFSIFTFTKKRDIPPNAICGGSGFNLTTTLPSEIENENYDWSIYPQCRFSIIWFSIGCIRNCPFCTVPQKEGKIRPAETKNLNPNGKYIKVMDNNFFANPKWRLAIQQLDEWNQSLDFQGVDVRLLNEEKCNILNSMKHEKQIHVAWDNPKENLLPKLKEVINYIKPYKLMCYVLIGFWSTEAEDVYRVEKLRELEIDPFAMPYDKHDPYQAGFARYVNMKAEFESQTWEEYKERKGIKT